LIGLLISKIKINKSALDLAWVSNKTTVWLLFVDFWSPQYPLLSLPPVSPVISEGKRQTARTASIWREVALDRRNRGLRDSRYGATKRRKEEKYKNELSVSGGFLNVGALEHTVRRCNFRIFVEYYAPLDVFRSPPTKSVGRRGFVVNVKN
jgi:hypothetical protein